jgi:predicted MFS family arabinose efflux permease
MTAAHAEPEDDITRHAVPREGVTEQAARILFRDVFAVAEFRALWIAQLLSVIGDQLARVALTVLVYDRTRSALLAAVTFVVGIVPTFIGGVTLAWLADRYPRRAVMIICDVIRGVLVLVMAIPRVPLAAMVALLFVVTLSGAPFNSARAAIFPDVLSGDMYVMGTAVTVTTYQFAQVIGFAVGGTLVGFFGIRTSLVIDAATFAASALIVRVWVQARPGTAGIHHKPSRRAGIFTGARLVLARPALRTPMLFGLLAAFYNAPEGVAAPLARTLGGGAAAVGVILAANALGQTVGTITFSRFVAPAARLRFMGPLAISACGVLVLFFWKPDLYVSLLILAASGLCASYQLAANSAFVSAAPQEQRSQAFGMAQGAMSLGQGVVMILAGAAAGHHAPALAITVCGAVGVVVALAVTIGAARDRGRRASAIGVP